MLDACSLTLSHRTMLPTICPSLAKNTCVQRLLPYLTCLHYMASSGTSCHRSSVLKRVQEEIGEFLTSVWECVEEEAASACTESSLMPCCACSETHARLPRAMLCPLTLPKTPPPISCCTLPGSATAGGTPATSSAPCSWTSPSRQGFCHKHEDITCCIRAGNVCFALSSQVSSSPSQLESGHKSYTKSGPLKQVDPEDCYIMAHYK